MGVFSAALQSGQLGPLMAQFNLSQEVANAAATGSKLERGLHGFLLCTCWLPLYRKFSLKIYCSCHQRVWKWNKFFQHVWKIIKCVLNVVAYMKIKRHENLTWNFFHEKFSVYSSFSSSISYSFKWWWERTLSNFGKIEPIRQPIQIDTFKLCTNGRTVMCIIFPCTWRFELTVVVY